MPDNPEASSASAATPQAEKPVYDPATVVRHLAHELRQPLSTIESIAFYLEMVLPRTEGKARRQLGKLQQEVHHINWILSDAIHFLQAAPLNLQLLDLTEVVAKTVSEWGSNDDEGIKLRLAADLPPVRADLEQMRHLLRNLVVLFGRISTTGKAVVLKTYSVDGQVALEAAATAPGMPADEFGPLFAPFDSRLPGGSGLGLASLRRIAEAHGARIELHPNPGDAVSLLIVFPASA